jgi:hypothetical protein
VTRHHSYVWVEGRDPQCSRCHQTNEDAAYTPSGLAFAGEALIHGDLCPGDVS